MNPIRQIRILSRTGRTRRERTLLLSLQTRLRTKYTTNFILESVQHTTATVSTSVRIVRRVRHVLAKIASRASRTLRRILRGALSLRTNLAGLVLSRLGVLPYRGSKAR